MNDIYTITVTYGDGCVIKYYLDSDDDNAISIGQHYQYPNAKPQFVTHEKSLTHDFARFADQRNSNRKPEPEPDPGDAFFKALPGKLRDLADAAYDAKFGQHRTTGHPDTWRWVRPHDRWLCDYCGWSPPV